MNQKGGIELLILVIVIIASFLLTGGFTVYQNSTAPQNSTNQTVELVQGSPQPANQTLQFKTLEFSTKLCSNMAVDFLVDNSGSMDSGNKLTQLKEGLLQFTSGFPDASVVALQKFAVTPSEVIPFSYYKDVKNQFSQYVNSMTANNATYTKDAFGLAKLSLDAAILKYPNYKFTLIFISDGVPETTQSDLTCIPNYCRTNTCQCFAPEQDPTDIANEIKQEGIRIITISYVDKSDAKIESILENLMTNVASSPNDYYKAPDSNQISSILSQISTKLCQ